MKEPGKLPASQSEVSAESPETLHTQTRGFEYPGERPAIHGILARHRDNAASVGHDDVLALTQHTKLRLSKARTTRRCGGLGTSANGHLHLANFSTRRQLVDGCQVLFDCASDVGQCIFFRRALAPTASQARDSLRYTLPRSC